MADPKNLLFAELFIAEQQARKGGKRKTMDTHKFEVNLYENLMRLRDAIWECEYKPSRGTAHVIFNPVQREIFAAPYPDRIVQHWVVNTIDEWWDRRLIEDSYSCRVGKGTQHGIYRLRQHSKLLMTYRSSIRPMDEDPTCIIKKTARFVELLKHKFSASPFAVHFFGQMCYTSI